MTMKQLMVIEGKYGKICIPSNPINDNYILSHNGRVKQRNVIRGIADDEIRIERLTGSFYEHMVFIDDQFETFEVNSFLRSHLNEKLTVTYVTYYEEE